MLSFLKPFLINLEWFHFESSNHWIDITIPSLNTFISSKRTKVKRRTIRDIFTDFKFYCNYLNKNIFRFTSYVRSSLWTNIDDVTFEPTRKLSDSEVKSILKTSFDVSTQNLILPLKYHRCMMSLRLSKLSNLAIHIILDTACLMNYLAFHLTLH
jgi:hypothetical protein